MNAQHFTPTPPKHLLGKVLAQR